MTISPTRCRVVTDANGVAEHHLIRVEVFVREQGLFCTDDRDEYDTFATTLKVVAYRDFEPAGTVPTLSIVQRIVAVFANPAEAWTGLETRAQWWIPLLMVLMISALAAMGHP